MNRYFRYLRYLVRHKYFVFIAGLTTKTPIWRLLIHDWTKLTPQEFKPYVNFFYPSLKMMETDTTASRKSAFRSAFLHHIHNNLHHFNYWVAVSDDGKTRAQEMPEIYIREMVADWFGAGKGISGKWDADQWYLAHKTMLLAPKTRRRVEELLASTAAILKEKPGRVLNGRLA